MPEPVIHLRRAEEADSRLLWEWANDPAVRAASFDSKMIAWAEHQDWFRAKLASAADVFYICVGRDSVPMGAARFAVSGDSAVISVVVSPQFRGFGVGTALVKAASEQAFQDLSISVIRALIKLTNQGSIRTFVGAGYVPAEEGSSSFVLDTEQAGYAMNINGREIGPGQPCYLIAEVSANHGGDYAQAEAIVRAAQDSGADAVKLQTYTADTLTLDSDKPWFRVGGGTLWDGRTLHDLYREAYTLWEWQPRLKAVADELGLTLFSTPFDDTAVDFLEAMNVPAYKIASFELVDIALIQRVARTGKPVILSTGMATLEEIEDAVAAARDAGAAEIALLHCNSGYPAPASEMHLRTIPDMAARFGVPVGLSDHTLDLAVPVTAVALGACILEKHLTLSRALPGPDSAFSLEPAEFRAMADAVRTAEQALGSVRYGASAAEEKSLVFRRSLFAVRDIRAGEPFTAENVRSIRPANGLPPKRLPEVLGRVAAVSIERGTPLTWESLQTL